MTRRERITFTLIASACAATLALTGHGGAAYDDTAGIGPGSVDGRFHECELVTEDGVTVHLSEYAARCWPVDSTP